MKHIPALQIVAEVSQITLVFKTNQSRPPCASAATSRRVKPHRHDPAKWPLPSLLISHEEVNTCMLGQHLTRWQGGRLKNHFTLCRCAPRQPCENRFNLAEEDSAMLLRAFTHMIREEHELPEHVLLKTDLLQLHSLQVAERLRRPRSCRLRKEGSYQGNDWFSTNWLKLKHLFWYLLSHI